MKVKTINNVISFTISSSLRGKQSRDRHSDDAHMCLHTSRGLCDLLSLSHMRAHTHNAAAVTLSLLTHIHSTRKTHLNSQ